MVKAMHAAGLEVILDVVYNHTAEGNHLGPTLSFKGLDNPAYYRLVDGKRALLLRHDGHRQQPQPAPPARAAADHGLAALLGHGDARRRLPLRPRLRARARVPRGRPAVGVLRPHPAGPGREPGQADRRAVGHRRGRLPGRQLPAAVVGVERQVPRHDPRLLARRGADPGRVRLAHRRLERPLPGRRPPPERVDQLRDRARRLHARRPHRLQRQAQRRQRRGRRRRGVAQLVLELRRGGADRRPADQRAAQPPAAQLHRHAAALPGHPDAARRRRDGPHAGRQQQRLLPGQRDLLVRLGADRRRAAGLHAARDRLPQAPSRVPAPPLLHARRDGRGTARTAGG